MFDLFAGLFQKVWIAVGTTFIAASSVFGGSSAIQSPQEPVAPVSIEQGISEASTNEDLSRSQTSKSTRGLAPAISNSVPPTVQDVCLNIEGTQTTAPTGFLSVANICNVEEKDDLCPNLSGIQPQIPAGRTFYKNTGTCLTQNEITRLEDSTYVAEQAATKATSECENAKAENRRVLYEIASVNETYDAQASAAWSAPGTATISEKNARVAEIHRQRAVILSPLEAELQRVLTDVRYYCD